MNDEEQDDGRDHELRRALQSWEIPDPPTALDARVAFSHRNVRRRGVLRRLWNARLSVPLPVAAALLAALLLTTAFSLRGLAPGRGAGAVAGGSRGLADLTPLPEITMRVARGGESR